MQFICVYIISFTRIICLLGLAISALSFVSYGQSNNDCANYVYVCGDTLFPITSNGPGNIIEIPHPDSVGSTISNPIDATAPTLNKGCLLTGETFSTWLMFPIKTTGTLEFYFATDSSSYPQQDYYDWTLFDLTGNSCEDIINNKIAPVRCNWNDAKKGGTGLADTLPDGGQAGNYEPVLQVQSGDRYVICFNCFKNME